MNETVKERIKTALQLTGKTQTELGNLLGLERGTVSEMLKSHGSPPLKYVEMTAQLTGYRYEWLLTGAVPMIRNKELESYKLPVKENIHERLISNEPEPESTYLKGQKVRILTVSVDKSGKELISYVPVKAQAGYAKGYGDSKFVEKLQAFTLPNFNEHGSFRMFQVDGDSMLQLGGGGLKDGDIVIGQYVEDVFSVRDNMVYVVISTEGVRIKRVINRLTTGDKCLVLKSDNKSLEFNKPRIVHAQDIIEVWEYKAHFSRQLNFATDLWDIINDLQVQNAILADRVDKMDSATRALLNQKK